MIATIDLSKPSTQCAGDLRQAFIDTGFAYVTNHDVPAHLVAKLETLSRNFFAQPVRVKNNIAMHHAGRAWRGYFPVGAELTANKPDQKEGIYFGAEHSPTDEGVRQNWPMHGQNIWPRQQGFSEFPNVVLEYMSHLENLGARLMRYVALSLGLTENYFEQHFTDSPTTLFRIFNYPQQKNPSTGWGVGEHTDMGFLTILLQDQLGGLEVLHRDGRWIAAPPVAGTFIINIGDMLQHWTHGIYKATLHRVRNTANQDRLSFPYFYDPNWQCKLTPIPAQKLDRDLLASARSDTYRQRWDGLDLSQLSPDQTYGDFVWNKIKNVFPQLA